MAEISIMVQVECAGVLEEVLIERSKDLIKEISSKFDCGRIYLNFHDAAFEFKLTKGEIKCR